MKYTKPACSAGQHLKALERRGLRIPDSDKALHHIKHIGHYRLTEYCIPFQEGTAGCHSFLKGASFDNVLNLYVFDRELRIHVLDAMERIEVAFRAGISNAMSLAYGPHLPEAHPSRLAGGTAPAHPPGHRGNERRTGTLPVEKLRQADAGLYDSESMIRCTSWPAEASCVK